MDYTKKNTKLLIIWVVLVIVTVLFFLFDGRDASGHLNKERFRIEDFDMIQSISMQNAHQSNTLEQSEQGWIVNQKYSLDEGMREVFQALFDRVRVQRVIDGSTAKKMIVQMKDSATRVQIVKQNGDKHFFMVAGDYSQMKSYYIADDQIFQVHIPGYQSYVAGMFTVKEQDWRNRLLVDFHWESLEYIKLSYTENKQESFELHYQKGLFYVQGLADRQDTTAVMQFVENNSYQYADQFIGGDNLTIEVERNQPIASLELKAFNEPEIVNLSLFTFWEEKDMYLAGFGDNEFFLMSKARAAQILYKKSDFVK